MTKYRVELTRQVWQRATLYVDAHSPTNAIDNAPSAQAIWHDDREVKNTFDAHAYRSEDVDQRDYDAEADEREAEDQQRVRDAREGFED